MALEVVGWIGSTLVVLSLMLANVWRFRVLNLSGAALATAYNALLGVWPFVFMNGAIVVINAVWLARLRREGKTAPADAVSTTDTVEAPAVPHVKVLT